MSDIGMVVCGKWISQELVEHVEGWIAKQSAGFKARDVACPLSVTELGIEVRGRLVDRVLQRAKRQGRAVYRNGYWHPVRS